MPETPEEEAVIVGPLKGRFTADAALLRLLSGTPLTFDWTNPSHFSVNWTKADAKKLPDSTSKRVPRSGWGTGLPGDVEFVIVSGTRLSNIAREAVATAVIGRRKIESYGVSTLADLLEYLPQIPFVRSEDYRFAGEQYADLRGFGSGTTLMLINGRRVAAS